MIRLDHITITVSNYVASRDWYASNFSLRLEFEDLKAGFGGLEDDGNTELILVQAVTQDRARDCSMSFPYGPDTQSETGPLRVPYGRLRVRITGRTG